MKRTSCKLPPAQGARQQRASVERLERSPTVRYLPQALAPSTVPEVPTRVDTKLFKLLELMVLGCNRAD